MLFFFFQAGKKAISHMELTLQLPSVQIQLAQTFHYLGSQLPGLINRIQMFIRFYLLSLQALIFMNQVIDFQCYKVRYNNRDTCVFVLNGDI